MADTRTTGIHWEKWAEKVEELLGHDLDGDQEEDGYSIDYAYDFYMKHQSVQAAFLFFQEAKRQKRETQ